MISPKLIAPKIIAQRVVAQGRRCDEFATAGEMAKAQSSAQSRVCQYLGISGMTLR